MMFPSAVGVAFYYYRPFKGALATVPIAHYMRNARGDNHRPYNSTLIERFNPVVDWQHVIASPAL
jgi:hypothetical protein